MNALPPEITPWGAPVDHVRPIPLATYRMLDRGSRHPAPANDEYDAIYHSELRQYTWLVGIIAAVTLALGIVAWVL